MKEVKKIFKKAVVVTVIFSMAFLATGPAPDAMAATVNIVGYGPPNGETNMPTMAPLDFMFDAPLSPTVQNDLSTYFSVSPAVNGSWSYFTEDWDGQTMYRVSFMAPDGLAANTPYTVSAAATMDGDTIATSTPPEMPNLSYDGSAYSFTITTGDGTDLGGAFLPIAMAGYPTEEMQQVPTSLSSITVNFDRPDMDASTFTAANIYLTKIVNGTPTVVSGTTVSPNTGQSGVATIQNFTLDADSHYRVYVTRDVKDVNGQFLAGLPLNDGSGNNGPFYYNFYTGGAGGDITASFMGTNLNQYSDGTNIVNVPTGIMISAAFDNPLNPITVSTTTVTLVGGGPVPGNVSYDAQANMINFVPTAVLATGTAYTFQISADVRSITGNAIATSTQTFTTTDAVDTTKPQIYFADADNYGLFIEFSELLNRASAENKQNYTLLTSSDNWVSTTTVSLTSANLRYKPDENIIMMDGLTLTAGDQFRLTASTSITDLSGNALDDTGGANVKTGIVMDASLFAGNGGMFNMDNIGMEDFNMADMGMAPIGVWPMSNMAGITTKYFIDIPVSSAIPSDGVIELKFPAGFNVTSVTQDAQSPLNSDFNGPGTGVVTFANTDPADTNSNGVSNDGLGVVGDRTVVIKLSAATQANDFLHIDLDGIRNSSVPKGFDTDGYQVEIKTKNASGVLLEALTSMPFFISGGGNNTISGVITATASANGGTMSVYLDSPMTGFMQTTTSVFANATSSYSFTNLPDGEYFLFTDPVININGATYFGNPMPEPIWLSASTTKNITIEEEGTSGTALTVKLIGDFSTGGAADDVDIFAGSPSGFRVKTLSGVGVEDGSTSYTLYLPDGEWMVGIRPAMPKGPMAGPPPMPDWMPPANIDVIASNSNIFENNGTADDGIITFDISNQVSTTITGTVVDGSGNPIADAEVFAYQPTGGFGGANANTATDGTFTLKIPVLGTYKVGAFKPGLPQAKEMVVDVRANVEGVTIKMQKPAYTISGQVFNANSRAMPYTPVWAYEQNGIGRSETMTDAAGKYILYVDNGSWTVESDAPGAGWMQYDSAVVINGASVSGIDLSPSANTSWKTISGTVSINDTAQANMPIRAVKYDANGNYEGREFGGLTDSNGQYSISVPGTDTGYNYYRVDIWTPDYGEVELNYDDVPNSPANLKISTTGTTTADIAIASANLNTTTIQFTNKSGYSGKDAFINIDGVVFDGNNIPTPTGFFKSIRVSDISGADATVSLKSGDYFFSADVPGSGFFIPATDSPAFDAAKGAITIDGTNDIVRFALPDMTGGSVITISGTVSGPSSGQRDAWVWIGNPETGFHTGKQASSTTGAYSLTVPTLSTGSYMVGADKPGYISAEPTTIDGTASSTIDFTLTAAASTVSGKIYADANNNNSYDSGEEIPNGWVHAENASTGAQTNAPVDGAGSYSLSVTDGEWKVFGSANGYMESQYSVNGIPALITVSGAATGKNIKLTADAGWENKNKSKPIKPSAGGSLDDTAQNTSTGKTAGTGVKITVPPNALGSESSNSTVSSQETSAVSATNSMKPFSGKGKSISATDNSGQPITSLDNYIDLEMVLYKSDIASSTNTSDKSKLKTMKIGYWDDTLNEWNNLATAKTAYYKSDGDTEWTMYAGTATQSGFEKFIDDALSANPTFVEGVDYDDYKLEFKGSVNHLTVFALGTTPDGLAPAAPTGVAQTAGNGTSVGLSWNAVTTNADNSSISDLYGYSVYRSTDGSSYSQVNASVIPAGTENYTDSTTSAFTSYYYKITAGDDDDLESAYSAPLRVCSTSSVSNGTIDSACSITCDSGYSLSGNSCVYSGATESGGVVTVVPCSDVTYDDWQTTCADGWQYRNVKSRSPSNCSLTTAQKNQRKKKCETKTETTETIEESKNIITETEKAVKEIVNNAKGAAAEFAQKITAMAVDAAEVVKARVNSLLLLVGLKRDINSEAEAAGKYVRALTSGIKAVTAETRYALTNFVTYGTPTTLRLGEGERAGVVNSYKSAFGKLPASEAEWNDVIKIANGRWPSERNNISEANATEAFKKIYLRAPDRNNPNDDAAVMVISYGLRPADRNLDSEKTAIRIFKAIYGYNPSSATAWDIVRAIAYSGATR